MVVAGALAGCSSGGDGNRALMCHIERGGSSTRTPLAVRAGAHTVAVVGDYTARFRVVSVGGSGGSYRVGLSGPGLPPGSTHAAGGFAVGRPVAGSVTADGAPVTFGCE